MMTRFSTLTLLFSGATLAIAAPAAAQHSMHMPGMTMPGMKMPAPAKPAAKKPAAKKPVAKKASPATKKKAVASTSSSRKPKANTRSADPHAGHDMSGMTVPMPAATPASPPPPTCLPEHAAMGHCTLPTTMGPAQPAAPAQPACPPEHAAMGHCTPAASTPVAAGASKTDQPAADSPPPSVPTDHAADAIYGAEAMAMGRHHLVDYHGGQKFSQVMLNIAEVQWREGRQAYEWDGEAWYGGDIGRFVLKSEGEGEFEGPLEKVETQALYSHAIGPYWNLQGGVRYDIRPDPSRAYATIGIEGLAPSFFDVEAALFLSNKGELLAKLEGYTDQRITQRLILQPRAELNFAAQDTPELETGAGLSDGEIGLRLRYDIRREFAPYVGVQYRRAFGQSRRYLRDEGERASSWSVLTGIRMWF